MAASIFGLGESDTNLIGTLMVTLFFVAAILVLPRQAPVGYALVYGFALCSPAVMLGVERGNVDLALFTMVAAAGLVLRRMPYGPATASVLILVSAILKLFPVAAIAMLTGLPRRAAAICISLVGGLFAVYAVATFRDIQTIERLLPQDDAYQYGLRIVGIWLEFVVGSRRGWDVAILALTLAGAIAFRRRLGVDMSPSRELDLFCAGAGIYVVTFALLRSYDYRLVFLLLTIPQLVRWAASARPVPIATLCGVLGSLWLASPWDDVPALSGAIRAWHDLTLVRGNPLPTVTPAHLVTFVGLAVLLAATLQANWDRNPVSVRDVSSTAAAPSLE